MSEQERAVEIAEQLNRGSKTEAQAILDLKGKAWLAWWEWLVDEERKRKAGACGK